MGRHIWKILHMEKRTRLSHKLYATPFSDLIFLVNDPKIISVMLNDRSSTIVFSLLKPNGVANAGKYPAFREFSLTATAQRTFARICRWMANRHLILAQRRLTHVWPRNPNNVARKLYRALETTALLFTLFLLISLSFSM